MGPGTRALTHTHGRPQHTAMRNCDRKDHRPSWLLKVKIHGDLDQILRSQKCSKDLMDPNCFFVKMSQLDQLTLSLRLALRSWAHQHVSIAIFHAQRPKIAKCQALRKYPWKSQTTCLFPGTFAALANRLMFLDDMSVVVCAPKLRSQFGPVTCAVDNRSDESFVWMFPKRKSWTNQEFPI